MKIQTFNLRNNEIIQIYMSQEEQEKQEVMDEVNKLKKKYSNVCILISGKNDTIRTIKEMLDYEKSKNIK